MVHKRDDGGCENRADPEHPQLLQRLLGKALILGEDGDASGTSRIQSGACYRIGDCGTDTVGETHGDGMAGIGLSGFTGGVERGGDDDDARDEFNGDGQSDAEGHAVVAERGIGFSALPARMSAAGSGWRRLRRYHPAPER